MPENKIIQYDAHIWFSVCLVYSILFVATVLIVVSRRKRRSSGLKIQRGLRTSFPELKVKLDIPTDTVKNRRVSFSHRTGVAEFTTNEATTNWKNIYKEHNKYLEPSENYSEANGTKLIASIGQENLFDKGFQEVQSVNFIGTLHSGSPNVNTRVSRINFSSQVSDIDLTKAVQYLDIPQNFKLISITDHQTEVCEDDVDVAIMGKLSDKNDLNSSMVQENVKSKDNGDLEQLQKNTQQGPSNRNCCTVTSEIPRDRKDLSEHIEVNLDLTDDDLEVQDVADIFITDIILNPKVQIISKFNSVLQKSRGNTDWVAHKENIVFNPYAVSREVDNFGFNEEPDKVHVIDGKRLTVPKTNTRKLESVFRDSQRQKILLNLHNEYPDYVDRLSVSKQLSDISENNEKLIDDISNISMTQSVPTNMIAGQVTIHQRRRNKFFNGGDIFISRSTPKKIIIPEHDVYDEKSSETDSNDDSDTHRTLSELENVTSSKNTVNSKRSTILFDKNSGDVSMTQVLPDTLIFDTPTNVTGKADRPETSDENSGDISCAEVLPTNIIIQEPNFDSSSINTDKFSISSLVDASVNDTIENQQKHSENAKSNFMKAIVFYNDVADISAQQATPTNILNDNHVTQATPTNISNTENADNKGKCKTSENNLVSGDVSPSQAFPSQVTLLQPNMDSNNNNTQIPYSKSNVLGEQTKKRKIIQSRKKKRIIFEDDSLNTVVKQTIPRSSISTESTTTEIMSDQDLGDTSITSDIPITTTENESSDAAELSNSENINTSHIKTLETSLQKKPNLLDTQEIETKEERDESLTNINKSEEVSHSMLLNKDNLSETKKNLVKKSANLDFSNTKQPSETSKNVCQTNGSTIDSTNIIENSALNQESKSDGKNTKTNQNVLIYQTLTNHGNIYSRKRNLSPDNASDLDNGSSGIISSNSAFSKPSDVVIQDVSMSRSADSRAEKPNLTSNENILLQNVESPNSSAYIGSKTSSSLLSANNKNDVPKSSPDKKKSMLKELLDMSNATVDYIPKLVTPRSTNRSKEVSQSVKSCLNNVVDSFDDNKDATDLPKDTSSTDGDNRIIYIIQEKDMEPVNKENDNVIIPILHKNPQPLETDNVSGVKPISGEVQGIVQRKLDMTIDTVKENEITGLDNSFKKTQQISIHNMQNDITKRDPLSEVQKGSTENNYPEGFLAIIRDCSDELNDKLDLNSNSIEVQSVMMDEKSTSDIVEATPTGFAPRPSVMNREDFLKEIAMAQEMLKNTNISMNDATTECTLEDMDDSDEFMEEIRSNNEIKKKIQFEDGTTSRCDNRIDISSSLRKHYSKPESSQDTENKSRVIPSYLKYVSEELKDLMNDLVKPTADTLPFEGLDNMSEYAPRTANLPEREVSMCSNQIQANLITSSQIDMDTELCSDSESVNNIANVTQSKIKSVSFASAIQMAEESECDISSRNESFVNRQSILQVSPKIIRLHSRTAMSLTSPVIVFDDQNPLNNVLLSPFNVGESSFRHEPYLPKMTINGQVTMQYRFKNLTEIDSPLQSGDTAEISSNESKLSSLEKVSVTKLQICERKDTTVNTIIAMRGNKDLLKASSLTLVDDLQSRDNSDDLSDAKESQESVINCQEKLFFCSPRSRNSIGVGNSSPDESLKMIKLSNSPQLTNSDKTKNSVYSSEDYSALESSAQENNDSTVEVIYTSENNPSSSTKKSKKKHFSFFRKNKHKKVDSVSSPMGSPEASDARDVTNVKKILKKESDLTPPPISRRRGNKHVKFPRAKKPVKTGTNMTVQHLSTDFVRRSDILESRALTESFEKAVETKNRKPVGNMSIQADDGSESISSWTSKISSSKVASDDSKCTVFSKVYKEHHSLAREQNTKSIHREGGSLNVVPQIEMLPDVGSNKCRWEACGNDTWSFSLLHGRLRLCVNLEHKIDNALKSRVRADTRIQSVNLYTAYQDESNTIAATCASFTAGAIRYIISHGTWDCAGTVPTLLRKSLALVRVALNWARAMHEAWYRLAFKLHDDNKLSLKVANIPLRSVWEVTMRFELVVQDDGEVPWPKAMDVQVHEVLSDVKVTEADIAEQLAGFPNDWSHVPRTLWKIYKHLKSLKKDDIGWTAV